MKAITLWEPWATEMRLGNKVVETRAWPTPHRGPLAIHAGKNIDTASMMYDVATRYPTGCVLGVVDLVGCLYMTQSLIREQSMRERMRGDWRPGRFAWVTKPLLWFGEPIPCRGFQKLWDWTPPAWVELALQEVLR